MLYRECVAPCPVQWLGLCLGLVYLRLFIKIWYTYETQLITRTSLLRTRHTHTFTFSSMKPVINNRSLTLKFAVMDFPTCTGCEFTVIENIVAGYSAGWPAAGVPWYTLCKPALFIVVQIVHNARLSRDHTAEGRHSYTGCR